jgi:hypothetical protein
MYKANQHSTVPHIDSNILDFKRTAKMLKPHEGISPFVIFLYVTLMFLSIRNPPIIAAILLLLQFQLLAEYMLGCP